MFLIVLSIIKKIGIKIIKRVNDLKKEYLYTRTFKLIINIIIIIIFIFLWGDYLGKFLTAISFISAGFAIALRDVIFNFFSGIYIKINKPFKIEDRIEINNYKGDVININTLNFEVLEVNNENFTGQSTGVIIHIPNSNIFNYPLRNYNTAFKYIWNEIVVKIPINSDIKQAKRVLYKIINSNEVIKKVPNKMNKQINKISNEYRIYTDRYEPTIYTKIVENHIELTIRYLINPKKARYIESTIWNCILTAHHNKEIELYEE